MPRSPLAEELLDHIVDNLHDVRGALKSCCLVSKSWIPRSRKLLFADVELLTSKQLRSWKTMFPDPSTSPARYTKTLFIGCLCDATAADAEEGGWIPSFSRVVHLRLSIYRNGGFIPRSEDLDISTAYSLVPFHAFSPALKSLHVDFYRFPVSRIFDLIYSFPNLKDLRLRVASRYWFTGRDHSDTYPAAVRPPNPPTFAGSLWLSMGKGMRLIASRLLSLPSGFHFRRLELKIDCEEDVSSGVELVEGCSSTLEFLKVDCKVPYGASAINLSKATKLKDAVFVCKFNPRWIAMALQTVKPEHQDSQISLETPSLPYSADSSQLNPADPGRELGVTAYTEWLELDRTLAKLHETHSIRTKVLYNVPFWSDKQRARSCMESLLPEATAGGMVDLVNPRLEGRKL